MKISMNLWIDEETKEMIQHWIDNGQVKSTSEFARDAFKNQLYYLYVTEAKTRRYMQHKNQIRN
jgi:hypothetical protein